MKWEKMPSVTTGGKPYFWTAVARGIRFWVIWNRGRRRWELVSARNPYYAISFSSNPKNLIGLK